MGRDLVGAAGWARGVWSIDAGDKIRQRVYVTRECIILLTGNGPLPHELNHRSPTNCRSAHESCSVHLGVFGVWSLEFLEFGVWSLEMVML